MDARVEPAVRRKYKTSRQVVYSCKYHVIWCPKYRRSLFVGEVERRLKAILHEVCRERQADLLELEVMPDHVHLLVEVDPQFGIHRLIRHMKGRSSRCQRQQHV